MKYDPDRSHWDAGIPGGTLDLAEIADELGYVNVHNFSRAFKSAMSISPGTYRKKAST